jgi:hypothetical protein
MSPVYDRDDSDHGRIKDRILIRRQRTARKPDERTGGRKPARLASTPDWKRLLTRHL